MEGAAGVSYVLAEWRVFIWCAAVVCELHRSAPTLTDVRRIAYEPAGRGRLGRFCLSPFAEGRLMKFGTIGAGVVHFGRHRDAPRQLRWMLGRCIGID